MTGPSEATLKIAISNEQMVLGIQPEWLTEIAHSVLHDEGIDRAEISVAIVDDASIHAVNRTFLNHDESTDVISFSFDEPAGLHASVSNGTSGADRSIDGEIILSAETAKRAAGELEADPAAELALYLVHGLLHLCGYDDHSAADRRQMRRREQTHLKKFGIHSNYED